jgi:hypothetical protein
MSGMTLTLTLTPFFVRSVVRTLVMVVVVVAARDDGVL